MPDAKGSLRQAGRCAFNLNRVAGHEADFDMPVAKYDMPRLD
jgi:hypothetical protein